MHSTAARLKTLEGESAVGTRQADIVAVGEDGFLSITFPVLDKGRGNRDDWDEIREKLVDMGTDIYNKIYESDL